MRLFLHTFAWLILLSNILIMCGASFYFVHTNDGWTVVAKNQLSMVDTVVDTRTWDKAELDTHPALAARLQTVNQQALLAEIAARRAEQPKTIINTVTVVRPAPTPGPKPAPPRAAPQPNATPDDGAQPEAPDSIFKFGLDPKK